MACGAISESRGRDSQSPILTFAAGERRPCWGPRAAFLRLLLSIAPLSDRAGGKEAKGWRRRSLEPVCDAASQAGDGSRRADIGEPGGIRPRRARRARLGRGSNGPVVAAARKCDCGRKSPPRARSRLRFAGSSLGAAGASPSAFRISRFQNLPRVSILSLFRLVTGLVLARTGSGAAGSPALASASIQREEEYARLLFICQ